MGRVVRRMRCGVFGILGIIEGERDVSLNVVSLGIGG